MKSGLQEQKLEDLLSHTKCDNQQWNVSWLSSEWSNEPNDKAVFA
jgi:hypothetical protein